MALKDITKPLKRTNDRPLFEAVGAYDGSGRDPIVVLNEFYAKLDPTWSDLGDCDQCGAIGKLGTTHLGCGGTFA